MEVYSTSPLFVWQEVPSAKAGASGPRNHCSAIERRIAMERIEKLVNDFKARTYDEKFAFMKKVMPFMADIFSNDP